MPDPDSVPTDGSATDPGAAESDHGPGVRVAAAHRPGAPAEDLLDEALEASGFWTLLAARQAAALRADGSFRVAVKPDLEAVGAGSAAGTDPELVEALVARLRSRGYRDVVLCDGRNRPDGWLHNRDALAVPDLLGYGFEAPPGHPYDFGWVEDAPRTVPLSGADRTGALRVHGSWLDADFRISFGKARSDEAWGYALCAANLLGLVSASGAASRWSPEDRCLHLLRRTPPDFAVLDAVVSSHGPRGSEAGRPLETDTVVASASTLLVDWVAALKMGLDPHVSPLNRRALDALGLPARWSLEGDTAPWEGWSPPPPTLLEATRARSLWPAFDEVARAVLRPTDRERFPFRDVVLDQLNATVLSTLEKIPEPRFRDAVLGLLAHGLAWVARARHAWACTLGKGRIARSDAPLGLDVDALPPEAFDETVHRVDAQARTLDGAPPDARGFRIRTIGGHIHFAGARILPLDFDAFVSRVEIGAAIRYMNDYLGGSWAVVDADASGRPLRQAERNVYLPQPNWIGAFGGREIDVEKLERIVYGPDRHAIWWRTVHSPNGSADSDDGSVSFSRTPAGQVEVRIFARQRFRLPDTVAAARVERWPELHGELVSDAYARFFDGTLANLRAAFDGEPYRIGRPAAPADGGTWEDARAVLSGALALVSRVLGWAPVEAGPGDGEAGGEGGTRPLEVDELGFAHFPGTDAPAHVSAAPGWEAATGGETLTPLTFLAELGQAVGRDLAAASIQASPVGGFGAGAAQVDGTGGDA